jgi:hypothetical protein
MPASEETCKTPQSARAIAWSRYKNHMVHFANKWRLSHAWTTKMDRNGSARFTPQKARLPMVSAYRNTYYGATRYV